LVHVVGADFGERSCPPAGGHGTAKREPAVGVPIGRQRLADGDAPNPAL